MEGGRNKQYRNTRLFNTETLAEELGLQSQENQQILQGNNPRHHVRFEEPDSEKSIILDDRGAIKRATLLKVIEKLTSETYSYGHDHWLVLLNTYRVYVTPRKLLEMLILRFSAKSQTVKQRVVVYFKIWVERHGEDWDTEMIARFRQFISTFPNDHTLTTPANAIVRLLEKPVVPARQVPPGRTQFDFWGMKTDDLAAALTSIEYELFLVVKSNEFLKVAWTKEDAAQKAPNIITAIRHFNKLGAFVRTEILVGETPSLRATRIKQFIDLALALQNHKNWNSFFAIIGTLESTPVSRLKKTWTEVEKLKYMETYNSLSSIVQPHKNFAKYREKLRATLPPAVPYLGLILNDIFFVNEGNKDTQGDLINFPKCIMIHDQIEQFQRFQNKQARSYDELTSSIKKYLYEYPSFEHEQDAYEESLKIEPKRAATSSARNSTSSPSAIPPTNAGQLTGSGDDFEEDERRMSSELAPQKFLDPQTKKMSFVHEPMTLWLQLLGSHAVTKVVLPSSYTAKEALVNFSRKLTGVTPTCSLVELPTNIIPDDAHLLPYANKKSQAPLVIFTDPKIVHVGVTFDKSLKTLKEMVLDLAAPIFSMIPVLQHMFDLKDQFSFLYVEETRVARWLNMNKTLDEQGFKTDKGLLLLYPLKNLLKENAAYKADADITGELSMKKSEAPYTFSTLKKTSKSKRYVALHDHFLLIFPSADASVPKKVLSLEHFRVKFVERTQEIALIRTFHGFEPGAHGGNGNKKGPSYVLSVTNPDDEDNNKIREWFEKIQINCGLIGDQTIFGVELDKVSVRRGPDNPIPLIIEQIIAFLLSMLSKEEEDCSKLFVAPADPTLLDFYRQHFDQGLKVEFTKISDNLVNTVGQLLMSYLIELPTPLLTFNLYDKFIEYGSQRHTDDYEELKKLVMTLPTCNRVVLCCILEFFTHISERAEELAVIFGPILLRSVNTPPLSSNPNTPTVLSPTASIIAAAEGNTSALPSSPLTTSPRSTSPPTPTAVAVPAAIVDPATAAACAEVVLRLIQGYGSILEHSREGVLVRRLIVKTRYKINTLSGGSNMIGPNGTVRSVKSDVVEIASDFQKKRQKTLRNAKTKMQEIEQTFATKSSGKSSLGFGHGTSTNTSNTLTDTSTVDDDDDDQSEDELSRSYTSIPELPKSSSTPNPGTNNKPTNHETTTTKDSSIHSDNHKIKNNKMQSASSLSAAEAQEKKNIYFVSTPQLRNNPPPTTTTSNPPNKPQPPEPTDHHHPPPSTSKSKLAPTPEHSKQMVLDEIKHIHAKNPNSSVSGTFSYNKPGGSNPKILVRKEAKTALVCAKCKAALTDNEKTCSACGHRKGTG